MINPIHFIEMQIDILDLFFFYESKYIDNRLLDKLDDIFMFELENKLVVCYE